MSPEGNFQVNIDWGRGEGEAKLLLSHEEKYDVYISVLNLLSQEVLAWPRI